MPPYWQTGGPGYLVMSGAIVMGYLVAGLLFLRFWSRTRDRLFLIFSVAFAILGVQRLLLALTTRALEEQTPLYALRVVAFVLILLAILDKNRGRA